MIHKHKLGCFFVFVILHVLVFLCSEARLGLDCCSYFFIQQTKEKTSTVFSR